MRPLALATIQAGLIDPDTIAQFKRWGVIPRELKTDIVEDVNLAVERIQFALEAEEQVRMQSTDLDILKYYMNKDNQRSGQLVVVDEATDAKASKTVVFAIRSRGSDIQYILPWMSESIVDILTNGKTYLRYSGDKSPAKVYFSDVEEMYFGNVKAFMVCTAASEL
jgi:hypothetical protein